jgi:hypothetical protein
MILKMKTKWQFERFKIENISSDPNRPCVQVWLKRPELKGDITASCGAVLGPYFRDIKEVKMYEEVRDLLIKTLNNYGQIRFVIKK